MFNAFMQAFRPFFGAFASVVNQIIGIFFDIQIFDVPIIMFPIAIGIVGMFFNMILTKAGQ